MSGVEIVAALQGAAVAVSTVKQFIDDSGIMSQDDRHGPSPPGGKYNAPFYIIYRSNAPFSSTNGCDGLIGEVKCSTMDEALKVYKEKKGGMWAYGVCDRDGYLINYNATTTTSFDGDRGREMCKKAASSL